LTIDDKPARRCAHLPYLSVPDAFEAPAYQHPDCTGRVQRGFAAPTSYRYLRAPTIAPDLFVTAGVPPMLQSGGIKGWCCPWAQCTLAKVETYTGSFAGVPAPGCGCEYQL